MTVPSLLILGTDAVLAATPATPVQLVHACLAIGYQAVIPASWGDELIAARVLERLRETDAPVLQCSCPLVAGRLMTHGASIAPSVLAVAAPPVATARYLRALYAPTRPSITYAGDCPSADHEAIDVWLMCDALASALAERGISPLAQPTEFDSVLPPDRRRFFSDAGGVPSRPALRELGEVVLAEPRADDLTAEIAQLLLTGSRMLIDVAPSLRCVCSGIRGGAGWLADPTLRNEEPPRALGPVVDHSLPLLLEPGLPVPDAGETPTVALHPETSSPPRADTPAPRARVVDHGAVEDRVARPSLTAPDARPQDPAVASAPAAAALATADPGGRPSPALVRAVLGAMPQSRVEAGRQLPRAYIARRRSTPRGVRASGAMATRRPSGESRRPMTRWLTATAVVLGVVLIVAWALQYYR